jgi:hypothetical protein
VSSRSAAVDIPATNYPIERFTLPNGLRVVLAPDRSARLDHDRSAQRLEQLERLLEASRRRTGGDRDTRLPQQLAGEVLVLRDLHADRAGPVRHGGPDQPPARAVTQLQQAQRPGAFHRDVAPPRGVDDRLGTRARRLALEQLAQLLHRRPVIRPRAVDDLVHHVDRGLQQPRGHRRIGRLIPRALRDDPVPAGLAGPHGTTEVHPAADQL